MELSVSSSIAVLCTGIASCAAIIDTTAVVSVIFCDFYNLWALLDVVS